ncbi:MAG: ribonuclease J [Alphaproteobacteria bacterium]|nr:ribonuclease J [Alphaproteobacteria bacterium]
MTETFKTNALYFVPLGGSGQFGANLNLYVCNGEFLAVDCGICFANERYPGIDILLPDPQLLEKNKDKLRGLVITHAHEDHLGAIAYLWERFKCPIYTTRFTASVLRGKLEQKGVEGVPIHIMEFGERFDIGCFGLNMVSVSHSIPDSFSLLIETPYGNLFHSGDWNLDQNSPTGQKTEEEVFCKIGEKGVLAYIGDSTNAELDGYAGSEADVAEGLIEEFKTCEGKIIITIFASNIARMISIAHAAQEIGRSVGLIGRSLHRMAGCAHECDMLADIPPFLSEYEIAQEPDENLVLIVTGSQGEHRAALAKISRGEFRGVSLNSGDTVIFSARAIPGNEKNINAVKNNLSMAGVRIVAPHDTKNIIHVSGHPYKDEIEQMLQWIKPSCVVPVHGEHVQLNAQAELAANCQIENVLIPNNGSVIRLAPGKPEIIDHVETALLAVDKANIIPATHQSITERRKLQYSGTVHASLVLDRNLNILGRIKVDTVGLSYQRSHDCLIEELQKKAEDIITILQKNTADMTQNEDEIAETLRISLRRYVSQTLGLQPKTTVHVTCLDV